MRAARARMMASLAAGALALGGLTTSDAQTPPAGQSSAPAAAPAAVAPAAPAAVAPAGPPAAVTGQAVAPGVAAPTAAPLPNATGAAPAAVAPDASAPPVPEAPPAPPAPPTDPMSIALLNTLTSVCIPSANGGALGPVTKAAGYRKSGDNYSYKQPGYAFTVLAKGSNPNACQVEITHPVDPEAPAKPLVIALHNYLALTNGWTLVRNDKHVADGAEFTTRTWEKNADGKAEAVALTTTRKADGSPAGRGADTSTLVYHISKTS